jgi:hypothetical protein
MMRCSYGCITGRRSFFGVPGSQRLTQKRDATAEHLNRSRTQFVWREVRSTVFLDILSRNWTPKNERKCS